MASTTNAGSWADGPFKLIETPEFREKVSKYKLVNYAALTLLRQLVMWTHIFEPRASWPYIITCSSAV